MDFIRHILGFNADSPLLFTQFYFWAFFALVYALFALIMEAVPNRLGNKKLHLRNVYLLFVSWFFYYKTSGLFLLILAFITLSEWLIAAQVHKHLNSAALNRPQAAKQQAPLALNDDTVVFFDTELIVTKVWFDYAFGSVPEWLDEAILRYPMDVYLLTCPDLPWIPDPARSNGSDDVRKELFDRYEAEIQALDIPYYISRHQ
jgi:hypothetical protein